MRNKTFREQGGNITALLSFPRELVAEQTLWDIQAVVTAKNSCSGLQPSSYSCSASVGLPLSLECAILETALCIARALVEFDQTP